LIFFFISVHVQIEGQHSLLLQHGVEVGEEAVHVLGPHVRVRADNIYISVKETDARDEEIKEETLFGNINQLNSFISITHSKPQGTGLSFCEM
jgi:hypothetical protein